MYLRNAIFASLVVLLLVQVARPQGTNNTVGTTTTNSTVANTTDGTPAVPTTTTVTFGSSPPPAGEAIISSGDATSSSPSSDSPQRYLMPTFGYKTNQTNDAPTSAAVSTVSSGLSLFFAALAGVALLVVAL